MPNLIIDQGIIENVRPTADLKNTVDTLVTRFYRALQQQAEEQASQSTHLGREALKQQWLSNPPESLPTVQLQELHKNLEKARVARHPFFKAAGSRVVEKTVEADNNEPIFNRQAPPSR